MDVEILLMAMWQSVVGTLFLRAFPYPGSEAKVLLHCCDPRDCYPVLSGANYRVIRQMYREHTMDGGEIGELFGVSAGFEEGTEYTLVEYWDATRYGILAEEQERWLQGHEHSLGRVPYAWAQNLPIPGECSGLGDIEGVVGLEDYANDLFSYNAEIVEYMANPTLVTTGMRMGSEDVPSGPGGHLSLDVGGDAKFLQWQGSPPDLASQMNRAMQGIQEGTGTVEQQSGRSSGAVESGAGISRLLMAGVQPRTNIKQIMLGAALSDLNAVALRMVEKLWGRTGLKLRGRKRQVPFEVELSGKDIDGYYANFIIFPPGLFDYPTRLANELQVLGAGLQSKYTTRENLGIRSPEDEAKRIRQEQEEELAFQARLKQLALQAEAKVEPRLPAEIAKERTQIEKGGLPAQMQQMTELIAAGSPGSAAEGAGPTQAGTPPAKPAPAPEETAGAAEEAAAEPELAGAPETDLAAEGGADGHLELHQVVAALDDLVGLRGQVYLVGELVSEGETDGPIEVLLTQRTDAPRVLRALANDFGPEIKERLQFGRTTGEPEGDYQEVGGTG